MSTDANPSDGMSRNGEDEARAPDAAETGEAAAAADDDAPLLSRGALLALLPLHPPLQLGAVRPAG